MQYKSGKIFTNLGVGCDMAYFIEDHVIEEIKERADIVDLIGQYVDLKKTGSNYRGLCPFHGEKTPSFTVSPQKKIYKCFGCGEGGSVINFLMSMESLSFPQACKRLADIYGIQISTRSDLGSKNKEDLSILYDLNRQAAFYYMDNLNKDSRAMAYLQSRDIGPKLIRAYGLGYAKDSFDGLTTYLKKRKLSLAKAEEAGLVRKSDKGHYYDFFRDRIMFPIIDRSSRVIGFGGRVLGQGQPKYLNTGETKIYHKGKELFGLNLFKKNKKLPWLLLVEGYMDVIGLASGGVHGSVASLGTAFTIDQARLVKSYTDQAYIVYDGDEAGARAAEAAVKIFHKVDFNPKVVNLPKGMDPEEYVKEYGSFQFKLKLREAKDGYSHLVARMSQDLDLESVKGRAQLIRNISSVTRSISSPIEKELYIQDLAKDFGVTSSAIKAELGYKNKEVLEGTRPRQVEEVKSYNSSDRALIEIIKFILKDPSTYAYVQPRLKIEKIANPKLKETYKALEDLPEDLDKFDSQAFLNYLKENYIIDDGLYKELGGDLREFDHLDGQKVLDDLIVRIDQVDKKQERIQILKEIQDLEAIEDKTDDQVEQIRSLLNKMMDMNR